MVNNVGQEDGEATLSEIHEREVKAFETQTARIEAESTSIIAGASRDVAVAKIYTAVAMILRLATGVGFVAGIHAVVKWW